MQITFKGVEGNNEVYTDCLKAICGETEGKSMADLCCNLAPHTPKLGYKKRVYVDVLERKLDDENEQKYFVKEDAFEFLTPKNSFKFDDIIMSDGIEHFSEADAWEILGRMQLYCNKMILFTPLGDYMVDTVSTDPEGHHSGWTPEKLINAYGEDFFNYIVLPQYHPTLNIGAFFFWRCKNNKADFERVVNELKQKRWTK